MICRGSWKLIVLKIRIEFLSVESSKVREKNGNSRFGIHRP